jgi:hypothetical protein
LARHDWPPDPPDSGETPPRPPEVPAILSREDVPPEVWLVAGRTPTWMWRPLLEVLEDFRVRRAHGRVEPCLIISYGLAKDVDLTYTGVALKPGDGRSKRG